MSHGRSLWLIEARVVHGIMLGAVGVTIAASVLELLAGSARAAGSDASAINVALRSGAALAFAGAVCLLAFGRRHPDRGLLSIEAGADWPTIIAASHRMASASGATWGIRQKQTGVDAVTLGGSISANAHGRGLLMQPLGDDIEDLSLVNARGELVRCNRAQNAELFSLVIGGYGLFGVIYAATLRLTPRLRLKRVVDIIDLDDAMNAVFRRAEQGCLYGDFQFVIDNDDESFLRRGVFACYKPSAAPETESPPAADLTPDTWLKLLRLAHDDKKTAFRLYAQHYLSTDGNDYWSDTMQLSTYIPSYADFLESTRAPAAEAVKETLVIGEHYVPREQLLAFMRQARDILIDAGNSLGGSFFLTYHRHASPAQVEAAYPRFREFLRLKGAYDPEGLFTSDWYAHYRTRLRFIPAHRAELTRLSRRPGHPSISRESRDRDRRIAASPGRN